MYKICVLYKHFRCSRQPYNPMTVRMGVVVENFFVGDSKLNFKRCIIITHSGYQNSRPGPENCNTLYYVYYNTYELASVRLIFWYVGTYIGHESFTFKYYII